MVPHVAVNLDDRHDLVAFEVRADPTFEEDTTLCPELDGQARLRVDRLRDDFASGRLIVPDAIGAFPDLVTR